MGLVLNLIKKKLNGISSNLITIVNGISSNFYSGYKLIGISFNFTGLSIKWDEFKFNHITSIN